MSQSPLAGVYDAFGRELTRADLATHYRDILGDQIMDLAAEYAGSSEKNVLGELTEASHGRLSGLWHIERYDAPIEWYAAREMNAVSPYTHLRDKVVQAIDFHKLPVGIRVAADAAMKRDMRPLVTEYEDVFENLFLTVGITAMWQQAIGTSISANSGASPAQTYAYYNNAQARICVGDSSTAASAGQTWLQAATNKFCVAMDATYPTQSTNQAVFRATFASGNANYAWNEFVIDNCNGSNSTSTTQSGGSALDRVVSAQGTKASGQTWQPSMTLTIS